MAKRYSVGLAGVVALALALSAAGPPAAPASAAQQSGSASRSPTATPDAVPTPTPDAVPTPELTHTPTPDAVPTPEPTHTPTPDPVPTPEPTHTPIPDPAADPPPAAEELPADEGGESLSAIATPVVPSTARLAGPDRYSTSAAAAAATFPQGAGTVMIAGGSSPIDGVIAAGMAASMSAPVLYVTVDQIPAAVEAELIRLGPQRIVVLGGLDRVGADVVRRLEGIAPVERFGGVDRYDTSRIALRSMTTSAETVYLAGGGAYVDSPLASVAAAATGRAALLVDGLAAGVDAATLDVLRALAARSLVIVGGPATVAIAYEESLRAAGFQVTRRDSADRFAQSVLMSAERTAPAARAIVVNPFTQPDVAIGAAVAAATRQPLLYSLEWCPPDAVAARISSLDVAVTAIGGDYWLESSVLANTPCSLESGNRSARLNTAIRATLAAHFGSFTVSVRQFGGIGVSTSVGGAIHVEPASMMKIFAAWGALTRIQQGWAAFETRLPSGVPLGECMFVMIHASDNYCHTDIVHWIGLGELNRMIRAAGFTGTSYGFVSPGTSVLYAGNRSTTDDLVRMMEGLATGTVLSPPLANHLTGLMRNQIFRSRIASGIPPGVPQASKPGALWIGSGLLQADTAIVNGGRYSYAISIIGTNGPSQAALRAISRTVYEQFHGPFGVAASYPVEQMVTTTTALLRSSPGGPAVASIGPGTPVQVHDANRVWYLVQHGSRRLWIHYSTMRNR